MGVVQNVAAAVSGSRPMSDAMNAIDLLGMAKADAAFWTLACVDATEPTLRAFFQESLMRGLNAQGQLSQLAETKGWCHETWEPTEQLKNDLEWVKAAH